MKELGIVRGLVRGEWLGVVRELGIVRGMVRGN